MNIKTIIENIAELVIEDMRENGVHPDDFSDRESDYIHEIVEKLLKSFEIDYEIQLPQQPRK